MEKLYCVEHHNAVVLPPYTLNYAMVGGAYSQSKPIAEAIYPSLNATGGISYQAPYIAPENSVDKEVIYCGHLSSHFGHFILESLSRLWFAKKHPAIPLLWATGTGYEPWQQEILDMLNIRNPALFLGENATEYAKLLTPIPGFIHGYSFHPEHAAFLACYDSQMPIKGKKVYVSRTQFVGGGYTNEGEIEAYLQERGWIIYRSENHSMQDKLAMFSSAEIILGLESSAFHALLFLKTCTANVFCLNRVKHPSYQLIPSVKKIPYATLHLATSTSAAMPAYLKQYTCDTKKLFAYIEATNFLEQSKVADFVEFDYTNIANLSYADCTQKHTKESTSPLIDAYYLASQALSQKKYTESKHLLQQALHDPNATKEQRAIVFFTLAKCYEASNDLDQAIMYARHSIAEINYFIPPLIYLTYLLRIKGDFSAATASAHAMMLLLPWSPEPYNDLALICENNGKLDEAIDWAQQAVAIDPQCFRKTVLVANLLCKKGYTEKAIEAILAHDMLIMLQQNQQETLPSTKKTEKILQAISVITKLLDENPKHFGSNILLANILRVKGDIHEAVKILIDSMALLPKSGEPHAQLALLYAAQKEMPKALAYLQTSIQLEPQHLGRKALLEVEKRCLR